MTLMEIEGLFEAKFIKRPNRYLAICEIEGIETEVHVHDPGRLKELLYEGNKCLVKHSPGPKRKTSWDMIAAQKGAEFVLIHSGYHRYIAQAILENEDINPFGAFSEMKAEAKIGHSRIDFLAKTRLTGETLWIEVKGCSLSENGVALFPDAPTERGTRHLRTLMEIKESGERAGVLLLILSESEIFMPKADTDPKFSAAFYEAMAKGIDIYPVKVLLTSEGKLQYKGLIKIKDVVYE